MIKDLKKMQELLDDVTYKSTEHFYSIFDKLEKEFKEDGADTWWLVEDTVTALADYHDDRLKELTCLYIGEHLPYIAHDDVYACDGVNFSTNFRKLCARCNTPLGEITDKEFEELDSICVDDSEAVGE